MTDKIEVKQSPIHGKGVFAKKRIRPNTLLGRYEGAVTHENDTYVLWIEDDAGATYGIDGRNELRYVNHSSKPNAVFWGNELFSLCKIEPGTEITFDYGEEWASIE
jgi:SET domain-containing protein